ncbi:MAG: hypothetical protein O2925_12185, partial [Actinomycetota bacterium]|nr:hypothetical protein [Actinomycetota bacterium]
MGELIDDVTFLDEIEGYCSQLSVAAGEPVRLHVSTRSERYSVVVERWGAQRRVVWSADSLEGVHHP